MTYIALLRYGVLACFIVCASFATVSLSVVNGQDQADVQIVFRRHIQSLGGADALRAVKNITSSGKLEMPTLGAEGSIELIQADGRFRLTIKLSGLGEIHQGCDGKTAWEITPQGARIIEGKERVNTLLNNAKVFPALFWVSGKYDGKIESLGTDKLDGREAVVVKFAPTGGFVETRFFALSTGELLKTEMTQNLEDTDVQVEIQSSTIKDFNGIKMPTTQEFKVDGSVLYNMTIDRVAFNQEIDEQVFSLPEEIKQLLDQDR